MSGELKVMDAHVEVIDAARELLRVLETDGGYTITAEAEVLRDCGDMGQPWTAIKALREALKRLEEE